MRQTHSWTLISSLELFSEACVAIDGSKFKAVNTRDTSDELCALDRQLEQSRRMSKNANDPATSARLAQLTSDLMRDKIDQQKRDDEKK